MIGIQGIYQIINTINEKVYIGSSNDIERRWRAHRSNLKNGVHNNPHLQNSWDKYGEKSFSFEIIENVLREQDLFSREQWFFDNIVKWDFDYNLAKDAKYAGRGRKHSKEAKLKISNAGRIRNPVSEETREKLSASKKGESNSMSQLVKDDVMEVRRLYFKERKTQIFIGNVFGVSRTCIADIVCGRTWRHI